MFRFLSALVISSLLTSTAQAAKLQILRITAVEIQETLYDEPALIVRADHGNPELLWKHDKVDDDDEFPLDDLDPIPFSGSIEIELWERDKPSLGDDHDLLGTIKVKASEAGRGRQRKTITNGDRDYQYVIEYVVKP
jgi:hypothetical protein